MAKFDLGGGYGLLGALGGMAEGATDFIKKDIENDYAERRAAVLAEKEKMLAKYRSDLEFDQKTRLQNYEDKRNQRLADEEDSYIQGLKNQSTTTTSAPATPATVGSTGEVAPSVMDSTKYDPNNGATTTKAKEMSREEELRARLEYQLKHGRDGKVPLGLLQLEAKDNAVQDHDPEKDLVRKDGTVVLQGKKGDGKLIKMEQGDQVAYYHEKDYNAGNLDKPVAIFSTTKDGKPNELEMKADALVKTGKYKTREEAIVAIIDKTAQGEKEGKDTLDPYAKIESHFKSVFGMDKLGAYDPETSGKYQRATAASRKAFKDAKEAGKTDREALSMAIDAGDAISGSVGDGKQNSSSAPKADTGKKDYSKLWQ